MKPHLARPALAVFVGGALLAGGALTGSPAYAGPDSAATGATSRTPATGTSATASSTEGPGVATGSGVPDLSTPDVSVPDLSGADPEATEPTVEPTPEPTVVPTTEPTVEPTPTEPPVDTTKPTGLFWVDFTSVWTGQKIAVSQALTEFSDPVDDQSTLKRVVSWGDGTSTALSPTGVVAAKAYTKAGNFKVTVIITDPAGNKSEIPAKTVSVTVPAGQVSLSKKSAYQGAPFALKVAKVPAGATWLKIDWSDGWISTHKVANKTITASLHYYWRWDAAKKKYVRVGTGRISGLRAIKVSWWNTKGYAAPQTAGTINILKDNWKPSLTITKPSSTNRASAWKTVRGTVADKGAGIRHLGVTVVRVTSSNKWYCLTQANKWKRVYSDAAMSKYCYNNGVEVKVVKGKWSLKVPAGIARNQKIWVEAWTYDRANNFRGRYRTAKITRS